MTILAVISYTLNMGLGFPVFLYTTQQSLDGFRKSVLAAWYGRKKFLVILPETDQPKTRVLVEKRRENINRNPYKAKEGGRNQAVA